MVEFWVDFAVESTSELVVWSRMGRRGEGMPRQQRHRAGGKQGGQKVWDVIQRAEGTAGRAGRRRYGWSGGGGNEGVS